MTKHYRGIVNTDENEKKILKQFRLQPSVLSELESLADDSGLDMTEIVEVAIRNVRPLVEKMMRSRLEALEKSGALRKAYWKGILKPWTVNRPEVFITTGK